MVADSSHHQSTVKQPQQVRESKTNDPPKSIKLMEQGSGKNDSMFTASGK